MDQQNAATLSQLSQPPSPVAEQIEMIFAAFGAAYEQLSELERRLDPILTPVSKTQTDAAGVAMPSRGGSTMILHLNDINSRIVVLENILRDLTVRVEA